MAPQGPRSKPARNPSRSAASSDNSVMLIVWLSFIFPAVLSIWLWSSGRSENPMSTTSAVGVLGLIVVWALFLLSYMIRRSIAIADTAALTAERLAELGESIQQLAGFSALSDDARRVLNRTRERELLRGAIEEDITRGDWEAAMILVKELADRFGYRADAEEFRQRIESHRFETMDSQVRDAVGLLDGFIIQRRWDAAYAEAGKIGRLFPDSPRIDGLRTRVDHAKNGFKAELERQFLVAAQSDSVDEAMDVLKELDGYLTEAEAAPYRETARGVIGKARDNLGAQFKLALKDGRWVEAVQVGDQIVTEFPNTRMAAEVRSLIDGIRSKVAAMA